MTQLIRMPLPALLVVTLIAGAKAREVVSPEVAVVARMYRDFAHEVVVAEPRSDAPTFIDQPAAVLGKYLDSSLVSLVLADRACVAKRRELCNLEFDPIWASQDPGATDLKVRPGKKANEVDVSFLYPGNLKRVNLRIEMTQTPSGPRIRDIHYIEGPSLLTLLKRKL